MELMSDKISEKIVFYLRFSTWKFSTCLCMAYFLKESLEQKINNLLEVFGNMKNVILPAKLDFVTK